jgi:hypothetical protein
MKLELGRPRELLGRLPLRLGRRLLRRRLLGLLALDRHQHFLLAGSRLARLLGRLRGLRRLGAADAPAQRLHQVNNVAGGGPLLRRDRLSRANPNAAVVPAEALSRKPGSFGAMAFSRTGDPATGDVSDAKGIRKFVDVPEDLSAL